MVAGRNVSRCFFGKIELKQRENWLKAGEGALAFAAFSTRLLSLFVLVSIDRRLTNSCGCCSFASSFASIDWQPEDTHLFFFFIFPLMRPTREEMIWSPHSKESLFPPVCQEQRAHGDTFVAILTGNAALLPVTPIFMRLLGKCCKLLVGFPVSH